MERAPPVPAVLLVQARLAARNGVSLDTVLRRYFAGYTLVGRFLVAEVEQDGRLGAEELGRLLGAQASVFDRLIVAISEEYAREQSARAEAFGRRHAERVQRLLAGELVDSSELGYELAAGHLAAIAAGPGAADAIRGVATALDRRLLAIRRGADTVWAWLGGRGGLDPDRFLRSISASWPAGVALALGEPGEGVEGWRLSHRQAAAALPVAMRSPDRRARYADVALLASILKDDLLATSLGELYLRPMSKERGGGSSLRETLRAYLASDRNVSSTAAALGVTRQTVNNRLRLAEQLAGRPLSACAAELDLALRLDDLAEPAPSAQ